MNTQRRSNEVLADAVAAHGEEVARYPPAHRAARDMPRRGEEIRKERAGGTQYGSRPPVPATLEEKRIAGRDHHGACFRA